eukprot:SM000058S18499  [mRNA]  locus=s58:223337:225567:+ [translate_table: standard]
MEALPRRALFGGALQAAFPARFQDVSAAHDVPDNQVRCQCPLPLRPAPARSLSMGSAAAIQLRCGLRPQLRGAERVQEVFVDGARDESVIVELLELKPNVDDAAAAVWFLEDLATEQEATNAGTGLEASGPLLAEHVPLMDPAIAKSMAVGTLAISKYKQGPEASNIVKCHVAVLRLKNVNTDVLITVYEPLHISGHSEVAQTVGAGATTSASAAGCLPAPEVLRNILLSFCPALAGVWPVSADCFGLDQSPLQEEG